MPRTRFRILDIAGIRGKECRTCSELKVLSEFHPQKGGLGGRKSDCMACSRARDRVRDANPEHKAAKRIKWAARYYSSERLAARAEGLARKEKPNRDIAAALGIEFVTLEEARARGLDRYFIGMACPKGHLARRITASRTCEECRAQVMSKYHEHNRERLLENKKARYVLNAATERAESRAYYAANRDKHLASQKRWATKNPDKYLAARRNTNNQRRGAAGKHTARDISEIEKQQRGLCAYCRTPLKRVRRHVDHIRPLARGGDNYRQNLQLLCPACNHAKHAHDPIDFAQSRGLLL